MRKLLIVMALIFISVTVTFSQAVVFSSTSLEIDEEVIEKATSIVFYEESCLFMQENHAENYTFSGEWSETEDEEFKLKSIMVIKDGVDYMISVCYVYEDEIWFVNIYRPEGSVYFYGKFENEKKKSSWEKSKLLS